TSGLFTLLHVRYLRKPLLIIGVYAISYMLGYLFEWSNGLLAPMLAHTLIDLVQAFYLKRMIEQERRM
ncbi:MAG: type II CAAX prenyl endopeptidase Rce1 family protein, partial [Clostridia bacterium]